MMLDSLRRRIGAVLSRRRLDQELDEEIQAHLAMATEQYVARGLTPDAARRAARRDFGRVTRVRERHRDARGFSGMVSRLGASLLDLKLAGRMLRRQPMLAGVSLLALGLGIPASLAPLHIWRGQMAPLPYEQGDRIVAVRHWDSRAADNAVTRVGDFAVWREELTAFQALAATQWGQWNVQSPDGSVEPFRRVAMLASAFDILRVAPALGRTLVPSDELPGAPEVVVIASDVWASEFGRDPTIVGRTIRVSGVQHTVVGVMPDGFYFPRDHHLWLPLRLDEAARATPIHEVFGRLRDGMSMEQAHAEVATLGSRLAEHPDSVGRLRGEVVTMAEEAWGLPRGGTHDPGIYAMQLLAMVLLLIVCGNVGIMMLARTAARSGEITIRTALGASRGRIVWQLYLEALVLALISTTMGLLVAHWAIGRYTTLATGQPDNMDVSLGWETLAGAFGLAFVCAGVAGVVPALKATGRGIQENLRRSAGQGSMVRFGAGSTILIVAQVALSVGALSFGVAWARTVGQDTTAEMGIDLEHHFSARVRISPGAVAPSNLGAEREAFRGHLRATLLEIRRRIALEPGVTSVAMARPGDLPGEWNSPRSIEVQGDIGQRGSRPLVAESLVDVSFFQDLGRPILDGRGFRITDAPETPGAHRPAVIVNTTFVEQVLGGRNPIGQRIRYAGPESNPWYEIIGVVGPLATNPVNPTLDAGVYHPARPEEMNPLGFVIGTANAPAEFAVRLRSLAAEVDPTAIVERPMLLSDLAERAAVGLKYLAIAPLALSGVAILLSAAGLYALMAFTVAQRRREIGLRKALGARPGSIVATIGRQAFAPLLLGVAVGATLAGPLLHDLSQNPLIRSQNMWLVVNGVATGTLLVGLIACLAPALDGLRVQPMEALKEG